MRVGFIGLGTMGRNAAINLVRKGFETVVYDIRPEALQPLVETGAKTSASPADVIDMTDVVITMVFGPKEIEAVVRGESGLLSTSC